MLQERRIFLDYGGLIFDYDFNRETLQRAHKLALSYINSLKSGQVGLQALQTAHNKAVGTYLWARNQDNSEWTMNQIMGLMVRNLDICVDVWHLGDIYKFNDHNSVPMPNARRNLKQISEQGKLGIISNLPHDSLITELDRENMLEMFDPIVISYQVGFRKPHPAIYQEALRRANTTPKNSVFISHDEPEVIGAKNIGMRGILVKSLEEVMGVL